MNGRKAKAIRRKVYGQNGAKRYELETVSTHNVVTEERDKFGRVVRDKFGKALMKVLGVFEKKAAHPLRIKYRRAKRIFLETGRITNGTA